ncbi:MAG: hypothetical protein HQ477_11055 [Chloroflexi bacterium]|nr:hypothetical protein [Chloroflexota bacterium]
MKVPVEATGVAVAVGATVGTGVGDGITGVAVLTGVGVTEGGILVAVGAGGVAVEVGGTGVYRARGSTQPVAVISTNPMITSTGLTVVNHFVDLIMCITGIIWQLFDYQAATIM